MQQQIIRSFLSFWFLLSAIGCASQKAATQPYVLQTLPVWAQDVMYAGTYLDIDGLMKSEKLSRFEAVEVQNFFRDTGDFENSLKRVRAGEHESHWKPVEFKKPGEYIVALDMDETLLMQWHASAYEGFYDLVTMRDDTGQGGLTSGPYIKFTPGAEKMIRDLKRDPNCRAVVVFSAKLDAAAIKLLEDWKFKDGTPALKMIDGVFTRNYLTVGKGFTVPSKDLRIFDESLAHIVLVDDNPARVPHSFNLLAQPKFDADVYYKAIKSGNKDVKRYYESIMNPVAQKITESARAANKLNIPFSQAFLPYSYAGVRVAESASKELTRKHPEFQKAAFVPEGTLKK